MPGPAALRLDDAPVRAPRAVAWARPVVVTGWGGAVSGEAAVPEAVAGHVARAPFPPPERVALFGRAPGAAALVAAIARAALHPATGALPPPGRRAIVVGTRAAALAEVICFLDEVREVGASLVNPGLFPFTVMNAAAGLAAIEHRCEGPNITLNNGSTSALDAVAYAADLVASGRADLVFAGGFEGLSAQAAGALEPAGPARTVAAVVVVTTPAAAAAAGGRPGARVLAFGSGETGVSGGTAREVLEASLALAAPLAGGARAGGDSEPGPEPEPEPERTLLALLAAARRAGEGPPPGPLVSLLAGARGGSAAALVLGRAGEAAP